MVSPVLLKLHGSPEKVGSFHGNFCHVLLIFPLQLHFYKFLVPNLDQLMLWQISVCLDITLFVSLCPPDVCPSAEFSKQGGQKRGERGIPSTRGRARSQSPPNKHQQCRGLACSPVDSKYRVSGMLVTPIWHLTLWRQSAVVRANFVHCRTHAVDSIAWKRFLESLSLWS